MRGAAALGKWPLAVSTSVFYTHLMLASTINQWSVIAIVLSGIALLIGVYFIRKGDRAQHMRFMLLASGLATVFLVLYLTRLGLGFEKKYTGPAEWRAAYYALLLSHVLLAGLNLPLALGALFWARKGLLAAGSIARIDEVPEARAAFATHRRWTRWTVPVWLYVAVTGWVIYLVLERYGSVMTR